MTYIINQTSIILFIKNEAIRIEKTDRKYPKIIQSFNLPKEEQESAILQIIKPVDFIMESFDKVKGFEIIEDRVYYKGEPLPPALSEKVKSIVSDDLPLEYFTKFWENLENNPSSTSVSELMNFLEYKELPITEDGCFLAYKGVNENYYSIHGNKNTLVIEGIVDDGGRIFNQIGSRIEVKRRNVDDNRNNHCSHGLHVGSFNYASSFGSRVIVVKINPRDVVSVPSDYDCQKCRVSAYEVVADYRHEITSSITDENGNDNLIPDYAKTRNAFVQRIENYINKKRLQGFEEITVKMIQNIFSPTYPSHQEVMDALQELKYYWGSVEGVFVVYL